ncbi:unnamed protein product [Rotaria magnacalcarata]|uniref:EGF-like domain-containing protein n=1 Tax=Rotaria magnacalcarata TaxID=392030 RepID=A0A8S2SH30_9BILA|nr:unnamed protein product [Rotaria magnacalcarata]
MRFFNIDASTTSIIIDSTETSSTAPITIDSTEISATTTTATTTTTTTTTATLLTTPKHTFTTLDCNNTEDYCECPNDFIGSSCEIQSVDVCSKHENDTYGSLFFITFGSDSDQFSSKTASDFNFTTNLKRESWSNFKSGAYAFVNSVPSSLTVLWHNAAKDHTTNDTDGYMYLADMGNIMNFLLI